MSDSILAAGGNYGNQWLWQALTCRPMLVCLAVMVVSLLMLLVCVRLMWRLGRAARLKRSQAIASDQSGSAMIEFTLILPIALFFSLLLAQTGMVMAAYLHVHYAAFAAARAAIIQIPADYSDQGEPSNLITDSPGHIKHDKIRQAAVFAVAPVGGQWDNSPVPADNYVAALHDFYRAYDWKNVPKWVDRMIADRLRYADANTVVKISMVTYTYDPPDVIFTELLDNTPYQFGPKDQIAVRVTHKLNLSIPGVRRLFATGSEGAWMYSTVNAQVMLTNEGVPTELPPKPIQDRNP